MGWWSTCYQVGGIAATAGATPCSSTGDGERLLGPRGVDGHGRYLDAPSIARKQSENPKTTSGSHRNRPNAPAASASCGKWKSGISGFIYFGFKLIRYSLLFWLPFYLEKQLGYSTGQAGYSSISFELAESSAPSGAESSSIDSMAGGSSCSSR